MEWFHELGEGRSLWQSMSRPFALLLHMELRPTQTTSFQICCTFYQVLFMGLTCVPQLLASPVGRAASTCKQSNPYHLSSRHP